MLTARQVLNDCRRAHTLLENEEDPQVFRILWAAAVALCRSVGHVLDKVDRVTYASISGNMDVKWLQVKGQPDKHAIFHQFIDRERNCVLKEAGSSYDDGPQTLVVLPINEEHTLDELLFCPIQDGRYAGEDCRDVLLEAISWWDHYLLELEQLLQ